MPIENKNDRPLKVILSGGGTGGHIYPAVSVAEALIRRYGRSVRILFVGAEGKMEMQKIPALGYDIIGLPITGIQRKMTVKNLAVPYKLFVCIHKSRRILRDFKPDVAVGFGGYASGPVLKESQRCGIPTVLWEGNSYAGMANRILAKHARKICVAYPNMERFFPKEKLVLTGNPLRESFGSIVKKSPEAFRWFGFDRERPTLLVTGGSLGTRTLNESVLAFIDRIINEKEINLIWQTGSYYFDEMNRTMAGKKSGNVWYGAFIDRMELAYSLADLTVSRAGAGSISELALLGMPSIFVPSPNVAEDHQTKNAMALVEKDAGLLVKDSEAREKAISLALETLKNESTLHAMATRIGTFAVADSADRMVDVIVQAAGW